jgi:hypothetical protein
VCVYYCRTYYKAVREGGRSGGHVLWKTTSRGLCELVCPLRRCVHRVVCVFRETTSRGQCELVCPSRTNERGGEGYCVKGGGCVCVVVYYCST